MKRISGLYALIVDELNITLADKKARVNKLHQPSVQLHLRNQAENLNTISSILINQTYIPSEYTLFKIYEPKERIVYRAPYYPDRIIHHALMNITSPILNAINTADTYSCIKGRGIHGCFYKLKKALTHTTGTTYCLKLDITKFYPSVNHNILKSLLRRKFKDAQTLWLFDVIIDSAPGLPIGNYTSQTLANFYLNRFDHWLKEVVKVKYYFRYADDIVILSHDKSFLHDVLYQIKSFLYWELKLDVKPNWRIFPVSSCGIDFIGYKFFHTHILLRKSIKKNFAKMVQLNKNDQSISSYWGWAKHANCIHLMQKLVPEYYAKI